ncbi:MAG: sigma 54-interacting transcriptional regulator [Deltaproteobacteria bacterium]|nr:sigma 54-interacting transcriptional regulator [Deltaproteobacteria bacterium]
MASTLRLAFVAPSGEEHQFVLAGRDASIGRAEHSDIILAAETVSARHGIFRANALGYTYTDLGSRNGSGIRRGTTGAVVGIPAGEEVEIAAGDTLLLGSSDAPFEIRVEEGRAPFAPARSLERTLAASHPLADLLQVQGGGMASLAARAIAAEGPAELAAAALDYLRQAITGAAGATVEMVGAGFSISAGDAAPADLRVAARQRRDVARFEGGADGAIAIVAPLIARGTWHGCLAAWSSASDREHLSRAPLEPLGVAASLVGLAASALAVRAEEKSARPSFDPDDGGAQRPLGTAPAFVAALELAHRLAHSDISVLLAGETGSGKELFARLIHEESPRAAGPFVAINCGAIPPSLLESELFGHVEGAFTGAARAHAGVFEQANGGTLFLDELAEMPLPMQAGILRALENGEIRRVGDTKIRQVDVRVVSATHRDLAAMSESGAFRSDLMYRVQAVRIHIPPLRERADDVLQLAHVFLGREARRAKKRIPGFSPEALLCLAEYPFPGNVRELKNEIARAVALTVSDSYVAPTAFSEKIAPLGGGRPASEQRPRTLKECVELAERTAVELALARSKGNVSQAARDLGLSRPGLYKVLVRLGLRRDADPEEGA